MLALFTPEQEMFADSVDRIAKEVRVDSMARLQSADADEHWKKLAANELLLLRSRVGGRPIASGVEVMLVAAALGGSLSPAPYLVSGVLAVELLALAGASEELLAEIGTGETRYGLLLSSNWAEMADGDTVAPTAFDIDGADFVLRLDRAEKGWSVLRLAIPKGIAAAPTVDITRKAFSGWRDVKGDVVGRISDSTDLNRWYALSLMAISAEIVGVLRAAHAGVVDYTRTRHQYGAPIGSFQAVQHMCAEMLVDIEGAWGLVKYAAWAADELPPEEALLASRAAKAYAASIARPTGETVMQVYGGIGQTWEHVAHLYARKAIVDSMLLGGEELQIDMIAERRLGAR
jgi:alkylation response protein AidB-like acyl-CoA dehydrogenase